MRRHALNYTCDSSLLILLAIVVFVVTPSCFCCAQPDPEKGSRTVSLVPSSYFSLGNLSIFQVGRMPNLTGTVVYVTDRKTMLVRLADGSAPDRQLPVYLKCDTTGFVSGHVIKGGDWHRLFSTELFFVEDTENLLEGFQVKTSYVIRPCNAEEVRRAIEIESDRARLESARKEDELKNRPEYQIATAKQKYWKLSDGDETSPLVVKPLTGKWWNGVEGPDSREMVVTQPDGRQSFTATCVYRHSSGEQVRWRINGTIDKNGYISGRLTHVKAPKGWVSQTQIAVLSRDGSTISGRAVFDHSGGHDFTWVRRKVDDK